MKKTLLLVTLFTLFTACSDSSTPASDHPTSTPADLAIEKAAADDVSFEMITSELGEENDALPMGYWQSVTSYPQIKGGINSAIKNTTNARIVELSREYSCEQYGDYSFSAEVKRLDSDLFSMSYEVMWFCPGMPSPDSSSGALNYNLHTGTPFEISSEFKDTEAYSAFQAIVRDKLLATQKANPECPSVESSSAFYLTDSSLVFMIYQSRHEDSGCNTEFTIRIDAIRSLLKPSSLLLSQSTIHIGTFNNE